MSKELLQVIRDINQQNQPATPAPAAGALPERELLSELQQRLSAEIRHRVQRAVTRFSEALEELSVQREPSTAEAPSLRDTQEIEFYESPPMAEPQDSSLRVTRELTHIRREIEGLPARMAASTSLRTASSADVTESMQDFLDAVLQKLGDLQDVSRRLEDGLDEMVSASARAGTPQGALPHEQPASPSVTHDEASSVTMEDAAKQLSRAWQTFETGLQSTLGDQSRELQEELASRLDEFSERLTNSEACSQETKSGARIEEGFASVEDQLTQLHERLDAIDERLAEPTPKVAGFADAAPEEEVAETASESGLDLSQIMSRLDDIESKLKRTPERRASDFAPVMSRLDELEERLLAQAANAPAPSAADTTAMPDLGRLEEWMESQRPVPEVLESLRRDLSMLVHTLNSHMEQSLERFNLVAQQMADADSDEESGKSGDGTDLSKMPKLMTEALAKLDGVASWPERFQIMLQSVEETSYFDQSTALQDAMDEIGRRMDQILRRL